MARPIYKMFRVKWTDAWHQLSQEERVGLLAKVNAALERVGGKRVILCDSSWASEEWSGFGVEEFPDIEAVQRHAQDLGTLNWYRYLDSHSVLGTEWQPPA